MQTVLCMLLDTDDYDNWVKWAQGRDVGVESS